MKLSAVTVFSKYTKVIEFAWSVLDFRNNYLGLFYLTDGASLKGFGNTH